MADFVGGHDFFTYQLVHAFEWNDFCHGYHLLLMILLRKVTECGRNGGLVGWGVGELVGWWLKGNACGEGAQVAAREKLGMRN